MTTRNFVIYITLAALLFACNKVGDKAKQLRSKATSKTKQVFVKTLTEVLSDPQPSPFSIRSIVTDFQHDKSITEIKGIQTNDILFYTEYCVYTGKKQRILKGVSKIKPQKVNDYT